MIAFRTRSFWPVAVEGKVSSANFDAGNLASFRKRHPEGANLVVAADVVKPFVEKHAGLRVGFVGLEGLIHRLRKRG